MAKKRKPAEVVGIVVASIRLFREDIALLKSRAGDTGVPWQTQLRAIVHGVLAGPKMRAFKFMIPPGRPRVVSEDPHVEADDCLAVATAKSQEEALALLKRIFLENGKDTRWLTTADVIELPLEDPAVLCVSVH